jgi:gem associated protein 2
MASKPCLPVSRRRKRLGSDDVDFGDITTMDAAEYLRRVVHQSQQLPNVLTSPAAPGCSSKTKAKAHLRRHVPIEGSAASLSYLLSDRTMLLPPPTEAHLPCCTSEWVDQTLSNFSQLRLYLDQLGKRKNTTERNQPVPPLKDQTGWHIFCLGQQEARGNVGAYFAQDPDDDSNDDDGDDHDDEDKTELKDHTILADNPTEAAAAAANEEKQGEEVEEAWRHNLPENGYAPTTLLMLQLDQVMIRRVLAHLVHYIQEGWHPSSPQRTLWLYALLARLEKPVHRNEAAILYALLQALTLVRASTRHDERQALARLNTLIVITGLYFEQGGGFQHVMQPTTATSIHNTMSNGS